MTLGTVDEPLVVLLDHSSVDLAELNMLKLHESDNDHNLNLSVHNLSLNIV